MPDAADRTVTARLRAMRDDEIDYSDIPPLSDPVWARGEGPKAARVHVVPAREGGWEVRLSGTRSGQRRFRLLSEALAEGRRRARAAKGELVVHAPTGDVRSYRNYAA